MAKHSISIKIEFEYGHRLLNYNGVCSNIHGHHGVIEIKVSADELNQLGMVMDFTDLKNDLKDWVVKTLDHACLLHKDDKEVIEFFSKMGFKLHVMESNPTAENIAKEIFETMKSKALYPIDSVRVWESPSQYADYNAS